jgi:hypothetical protein
MKRREYNKCITPEKNKLVKNPLWWIKIRKGITSIGTGIVGSRLLALLLHIVATPIGVSMWFIRNFKNAISVDMRNRKNNARPVFASAPYALALALITAGSVKLYTMNPRDYINDFIDSAKTKITEKVIEKTVPIVPTTRTKSFGKDDVTNTVENIKDTVKDNVIWIGENLVTNPVVEPEPEPEVSEEIVEEVIEEPASTVEEVEEPEDIGPAQIDPQVPVTTAEASGEVVEKNPEGAIETPDVRRSFVQ